MSSDDKVLFIVFGPQGSGKSTQGQRLAQRLNLPYFESGAILRAQASTDPSLNDNVTRGILVTDEQMQSIVERFLAQHPNKRGFVFDGFPRTLSQVTILDQMAAKYGWRVIGIYLKISDETVRQRLATRYQLINGKQARRADDTPEIISKRLATYHQRTRPILDNLKKRHVVIEIDGEQPIDIVTDEIWQAVGPR